MSIKPSNEKFIERVKKSRPEIDILNEYTGINKTVLRRCNLCGDIRNVVAKSLIDSRKCVVCAARSRNNKKSNETFLLELSSKYPNIDPLEDYIKTDVKIKFKCNIDGYIWSATPKTVLEGHGCPECSRKQLNRRTDEEFKNELCMKHPNIITNDKFCGTSRKINFKCTLCGYEWNAVPNALLNSNNSGCPMCLGKAYIPLDIFLKRLNNATHDVSYVSGYECISKKCLFKCEHCGNIFESLPTNILAGKGCSKCKCSHGERKVEIYLKNNNFQYIKEYRFKDCVDERELPFDFYLPSVNTCIEYDGIQHFQPSTFNGANIESAILKYEKQKMHDKIKDAYCIKNNIKLIRIPYTDYEFINDILDKQLL